MQTKQHSKHINYNRSLLFFLFRIPSLPPLLFPLIFHLIKSNQHHMWKMCLNVETAEKTKSKSRSVLFCTRQKFSNNSLYCIVLYPIVDYWKPRYLFFHCWSKLSMHWSNRAWELHLVHQEANTVEPYIMNFCIKYKLIIISLAVLDLTKTHIIKQMM